MSDTLKPCPFCGEAAELRSWDWPYARFQVRCGVCKAGPVSRLAVQTDVIAAWNRRAAHDEMERLRADAQAAVALVIEGAVNAVKLLCDNDESNLGLYEALDAIQAAADVDGLAEVAKLRMERDKWFEGAGAHHVASMQQAQRADRLAADNARLAAQVQALTGALKEAGDYLEACKVNGLPDLGAASRMPFLDDVIANVDAALTIAAMTPQEQANYHAMMGQRRRLKPNPDGTIPVTGAPEEYEWNARYDAAWPTPKDDKNG